MPRHCLVIFALSFLLHPLMGQEERAHSKVPPKGAPWVRDFVEARKLALKAGKPIFVYSTKTY